MWCSISMGTITSKGVEGVLSKTSKESDDSMGGANKFMLNLKGTLTEVNKFMENAGAIKNLVKKYDISPKTPNGSNPLVNPNSTAVPLTPTVSSLEEKEKKFQAILSGLQDLTKSFGDIKLSEARAAIIKNKGIVMEKL